ncbi:CapA family protein [Deinococcus radiodurans]|nr:CapA family protein [Deinococcus radiodurans]
MLANLESPLTNRPKATSGIDLRASPAAVAALRPFTALSTENNHAGDGGEAGRRQNEQVLRGSGLVPVSRQVTWLNVKGVNLALLAYLDDGRSPPPLAEVRRAAAQADLVVVLPHWGAEYNGVTARQRQQARALVDAGAGLVVGSGPHVLQGHEWLGRALVLYSLGNLLFDQPYPRPGPERWCMSPSSRAKCRRAPSPPSAAPDGYSRAEQPNEQRFGSGSASRCVQPVRNSMQRFNRWGLGAVLVCFSVSSGLAGGAPGTPARSCTCLRRGTFAPWPTPT